jgi:cyclopropane fatty-acyl-phospholipid synthase-like methyltransferase
MFQTLEYKKLMNQHQKNLAAQKALVTMKSIEDRVKMHWEYFLEGISKNWKYGTPDYIDTQAG